MLSGMNYFHALLHFESRFNKIIYALMWLLCIKARVYTIVKLCCALLSSV
jgi:hypothetical protein